MIAGRSAAATTAGTLVLLIATAISAAAYPHPGQTERVSVGAGGAQGNADSRTPSISADGRYVAFSSVASNLVGGDTNQRADVFLHDRETGAIERVSVGAAGVEANAGSLSSSVSAEGTYVAFESAASNLVSGDTNGQWDVFVHDRRSGATERVSVSSNEAQGEEDAFSPSISADGRYVAFYSRATNLVPADTNGVTDVFVRDRLTGLTERISVATGGTQGAGHSFAPSISVNGRYVAFWSGAPNLGAGDTNGKVDVFVHDREARTTDLVSVSSDGTQGNGHSYATAVSADGRFVAFESWASNLVPTDTNAAPDLFLRDRQLEVTERISVASDGAEGNGYSFSPSISADGRYVAFYSLAANLVPGDTGTPDVFVRDRATGATERVSIGIGGAAGDRGSASPSISADGRSVAFYSEASNLVPGDTNGSWDVFVRDRGPSVGVGELSVTPERDRLSVSGWATFAGAMVAAGSDSQDDGADGADQVGAELTGASLTYRPETEDLLVRMRPSSLPGATVQPCVQTPTSPPLAACVDASTGGGVPGIVYGLAFELDAARYEVRATRAEGLNPSADAYFALYRCDSVCIEQARLTGGIGTAGPDVRVALPLSALRAAEGAGLTRLRAFTGLGEAVAGSLVALDEVELGHASIPGARVELGIAPASIPEGEVTYASNADLVDGDFSANLDVSALAAGDYRVWARGCLADDCGARSSAFRLVRAAPTCFEDDAAQLAYEPGWHRVEDTDASAGHFRLGHGKGLSFSFGSEAAQGTLRYVFATSSKGGSADLYLDGQLVRTVSYRGESGSLRSPVFGAEVELPLTGAGEHTFELRNVEGAAYLDTICLSHGSSQAQPAAGPGPTSTNTGSVDAGSQLSQPLTVPSGTMALAVLAESDSPLPYTLALLDATGNILATTQSSPDGTASLQASVTGSGPHLIQLLNPGLGHITFWTAATPHLAVR